MKITTAEKINHSSFPFFLFPIFLSFKFRGFGTRSYEMQRAYLSVRSFLRRLTWVQYYRFHFMKAKLSRNVHEILEYKDKILTDTGSHLHLLHIKKQFISSNPRPIIPEFVCGRLNVWPNSCIAAPRDVE